MLSVDSSADMDVMARIQSGWNKFRQLSVFVTTKGTPYFKRDGVQYGSYVRSCLLHGSETCPVTRKMN